MKKYLLTLAATGCILSSASFSSAQTCTILTKPLSAGSKGSEVTALQQFLYDQGNLKTKPNGTFGTATVSGLKAFQKKNNLASNGFVGPAVRTKIKEVSCVKSTSDIVKTTVISAKNITSTSSQKETIQSTKTQVSAVMSKQNKEVATGDRYKAAKLITVLRTMINPVFEEELDNKTYRPPTDLKEFKQYLAKKDPVWSDLIKENPITYSSYYKQINPAEEMSEVTSSKDPSSNYQICSKFSGPTFSEESFNSIFNKDATQTGIRYSLSGVDTICLTSR